MLQPKPAIAEIKNQWLFQQVDVEYPTPESLAGRELYQQSLENKTYERIDVTGLEQTANSPFEQEDVYLVDFHRLTVVFSLLQAKKWQKPAEQNLVVEFLSQIIYSDPCELYLAFSEGEAIAAAIVTHSENTLLISDLSFDSQQSAMYQNAFVSMLIEKSNNAGFDYSDIYLEK